MYDDQVETHPFTSVSVEFVVTVSEYVFEIKVENIRHDLIIPFPIYIIVLIVNAFRRMNKFEEHGTT